MFTAHSVESLQSRDIPNKLYLCLLMAWKLSQMSKLPTE